MPRMPSVEGEQGGPGTSAITCKDKEDPTFLELGTVKMYANLNRPLECRINHRLSVLHVFWLPCCCMVIMVLAGRAECVCSDGPDTPHQRRAEGSWPCRCLQSCSTAPLWGQCLSGCVHSLHQCTNTWALMLQEQPVSDPTHGFLSSHVMGRNSWGRKGCSLPRPAGPVSSHSTADIKAESACMQPKMDKQTLPMLVHKD